MADLSKLSNEELMAAAGISQPQGMNLQNFGGFTDTVAQPRPVMDDLGIANIGESEVNQLMGVPNAPDLSQLSNEELMAQAGIQLESAPPTQTAQLQQDFEAKKGLFGRIGEAYDKRNTDLQSAQNDYISGKRGLPRTTLRVAGDISNFANDALGEVLGSGLEMASSVPSYAPVFGPAGQAIKGVGNVLSSIASSDTASKISSGIQNLSKEYPEASRDIRAAGGILGLASAFTPVEGVSAASKTGDLALAGAEKSLTKLATPKRILPNSDQLLELSKNSYKAARESGEVFSPETVTNKFVNSIELAKPSKIGGKVETSLSQDLESSLGKYKELTDSPLSIDEVDIIDKDLSNLKDQAYSSGKNQLASEYGNIQNSLRGSVAESPGGKNLSEARDMFRRKFQMEDVERIFRNAEGRPNEASIIQTGYRNLANQARKKGSGYTKEQIAIMDKAAKGGLSIDALKLASSKLIPIVAGANSGPVGAGVAYMGNMAAAAGATALQTAKANKLAKSITKGLSVPAEPTAVNKLAKLQADFLKKKVKK